MKNLKISSVILAVVFWLLSSNFVYAWNDKFTHPALTLEAVENFQEAWLEPYLQNKLGFKKHVSEQLQYDAEIRGHHTDKRQVKGLTVEKIGLGGKGHGAYDKGIIMVSPEFGSMVS